MKRTYVYKLKPNKAQIALLEQTVETCRHLYNACLAERKEAWEQEGRSVNFYEQDASLPQRKEQNSYLPLVHSQVLKNVVKRVDLAFQAFFRRVKKGETPGYPRFKGKGWYDSFCYPQYSKSVKMEGNHLHLSKIGSIKICKNRPLEGTPKTCTLCRKADGWFAFIVCEVEAAPLPATEESVGIDIGIENFATLSTGEVIENPRLLRKSERKLKTAQRKVTRRKRGSKNRKKAVQLLAKQHLKVSRARRDFAHKTARTLVNRFDTIAVEDLTISNMVRRPKAKQDVETGVYLPNGAAAKAGLNKSILEAGWGLFLQILKVKAESAGRIVKEVPPAYTSQDCSQCGQRVPKKLSVRTHSCPFCGLVLHRDVNAAVNIKTKGEGIACGEAVPLGKPKNRESSLRTKPLQLVLDW